MMLSVRAVLLGYGLLLSTAVSGARPVAVAANATMTSSPVVTLATDAVAYRVGSPVTLSVAMRNLSKGPLLFDAYDSLELRIVDDHGERVPTLRHEVYATSPEGTVIPDSSVTLAVGATYRFAAVTLSRMGILLEKPGKYGLTMVVTGRDFSVGSNQVWITIQDG